MVENARTTGNSKSRYWKRAFQKYDDWDRFGIQNKPAILNKSG